MQINPNSPADDQKEKIPNQSGCRGNTCKHRRCHANGEFTNWEHHPQNNRTSKFPSYYFSKSKIEGKSRARRGNPRRRRRRRRMRIEERENK